MKKNLIKNLSFHFLLSFPGLLSWVLLFGAILLILFNPNIFVVLIILFSVYWTINCSRIVFHAYFCHKRVENVKEINWLKKLQKDFPKEWKSYYYCTLIPFASESVNVLKPTIDSIADSNFPKKRKFCACHQKKQFQAAKKSQSNSRKNIKTNLHIFS